MKQLTATEIDALASAVALAETEWEQNGDNFNTRREQTQRIAALNRAWEKIRSTS